MAQSGDIHVNLDGQFGYQNAIIHTNKVLGTGSYGSVVKATLDHLLCAAKILHIVFFRDDDPGAVEFATRFDQECAILRELKHPCIVQFLGVVQDPSTRRSILLMELMEDSLTGFLEHSTTSLPYHVQVNIIYDITQALTYLHNNNILHRDLSSNNILLKGHQAKVTDFGMAKMVECNPHMTYRKHSQCPGTPVFMPPEALRTKPRYSDKLDTFSVGVLMIQIVTCTYPAPTDSEIILEDDLTPTREKIVLVPELERRKDDIAKVPSDHALLPVALHCLKDRDRDRPTAAQLCESLEQIKTTSAYSASERDNQASRASLEHMLRQKEEEKAMIAKLKEAYTEQQQMKENEVEVLKCQLQLSQQRLAQMETNTEANKLNH